MSDPAEAWILGASSKRTPRAPEHALDSREARARYPARRPAAETAEMGYRRDAPSQQLRRGVTLYQRRRSERCSSSCQISRRAALRAVHSSGRGAPAHSAYVSDPRSCSERERIRAREILRVQSRKSSSPAREWRSKVQAAYINSTNAMWINSWRTVRLLPSGCHSSCSSERPERASRRSRLDWESHRSTFPQSAGVSGSRSAVTRASESSDASTIDSTSSATTTVTSLPSSTDSPNARSQFRNSWIASGSFDTTSSRLAPRTKQPGSSCTQAR